MSRREGGFAMRICDPSWAIAVALMFFSGFAQAQQPTRNFSDLVAQAEKGDPATDYTALRLAYAQSDGYDPYSTAVRKLYGDIWPAFQAKDCAKVASVSDEMLKIDYTLVAVHFMRADCFKQTGDIPRSEREVAIAKGLAQSLLHSGDGKGVDTAYVVVTMAEERFLLTAIGLTEEQQSLLNHNGRMYDLIQGKNQNPGGPVSACFDVSLLFAGLAHKLGHTDAPVK
jgi:hypothetical protein